MTFEELANYLKVTQIKAVKVNKAVITGGEQNVHASNPG